MMDEKQSKNTKIITIVTSSPGARHLRSYLVPSTSPTTGEEKSSNKTQRKGIKVSKYKKTKKENQLLQKRKKINPSRYY